MVNKNLEKELMSIEMTDGNYMVFGNYHIEGTLNELNKLFFELDKIIRLSGLMIPNESKDPVWLKPKDLYKKREENKKVELQRYQDLCNGYKES